MRKGIFRTKLGHTVALFAGAMVLATGQVSEARTGRGGAFDDALAAGAGVVSPGAQGAAVFNPAGLIYNSRFKIQVHGDSFDSSASVLGEGVRMTYGAGNFAATLGGHYLNLTQGISVDAGLGFYVEKLRTAFGVNWGFPVSQGGSAGAIASSDGTAGIIINPMGRFQVGVMGFSLLNAAARSVGAGLAYQFSPSFTLLTDAVYGLAGGGILLVPALKVHFAVAQLSLGYAVDLSAGVGTLASAIRAGVGFDISNRVQLHFYYNQFATYHAALAIQL